MIKRQSDGQLIRIFLAEADRLHGRPLFQLIVEQAREMGLEGATVLRGVEGYGSTAELHTTRLLRLADNLPLIIEVVESSERIEPFLKQVETLLEEADCGALVTLKPATVLRYIPEEKD